MRKLFLSVAVVLGLAVAAVSCSKDNKESDLDKGKKAGKEYCACIEKAGDDEEAQDKCDADSEKYENESIEFGVGYLQEVMSCMGDFPGLDGDDDEDDE